MASDRFGWVLVVLDWAKLSADGLDLAVLLMLVEMGWCGCGLGLKVGF